MKYLPILLTIFLYTTVIVRAEDTTVLPDLPAVQNTDTTPEVFSPETTRQLPTTDTRTPQMPRVSQEQIDKAQKDKNWLTEGLKEKELQAESLRQEEAKNQKTIIDEILERNQKQVSKLNTQNAGKLNQTNSTGTMKAALSTTAWEPLPEMQSSQYQAAMGETNSESSEQADYKKYDEQTGISNVFFNPVTGSFQNQPVENTANFANRPENSKPWLQQQNTPTINAPEQKQVEAIEAKLVEQARAQNRLPDTYQKPSFGINSESPYLLANNTTGSSAQLNSNLQNSPLSTDTSAGSGYRASAAKLRMMEEERERKLKASNRPKAVDLHSPLGARGIEINPRF